MSIKKIDINRKKHNLNYKSLDMCFIQNLLRFNKCSYTKNDPQNTKRETKKFHLIAILGNLMYTVTREYQPRIHHHNL